MIGVTRWAWPIAAAVAAGFIAVLAFHGERPEPGLERFTPAGLLADWPIEQVIAVEVSAGADRRSFHRGADGGWHLSAGDAPLGSDLAERIETGLKLLRNSAPQRNFAAGELEGRDLAEFGLDPPRLMVGIRGITGGAVTIQFGGANPLGLARYTRIDGRPQIWLLPSFVAEAWERVAERR